MILFGDTAAPLRSGSILLENFSLESVAERNLYVEGVDFGLNTLKIMAIGGDKISTYLYTEIVLVIVAADTNMPTHLETVPSSILTDGIITFAVIEYIDPLVGLFLTVDSSFFFILSGEMKLEIKTNIRIDRYTVGNIETIYVVYRNLKIDILELGFILVALIFLRLVAKKEINIGTGFYEHVLGNAKAMDVVEAETIETGSLTLIGPPGSFLVEVEISVVIRHSYAVVAFCAGN